AGIDALGDAERGLGERPTHPIVVSTFRGVTGAQPLTAAWISPAVLAAAIALAAGALATDGLREPRRRSAAYAVGVGASGFVAWTAVGYAANLMLDPVALALVLAAILAAFQRRGILAGISLGLGAALIHWMFTLVVIGLLLGFALALAIGANLPGVWAPPVHAARRVLQVLGGGVVAGGVALGLSPMFPSHVFLVEPGTSGDVKAEQRLPSLALWLTLPLALLGGVLGLTGGSGQRRWTTGVLLAWAALAPMSLIAWYALDLPVPPYRWTAFALGIPMLVVFAAACIGERVRARSARLGRPLTVTLLVVASGGLAVGGARIWDRADAGLEAEGFVQLEAMARYLDGLPADLPVFLTTPSKVPSAVVPRIQAGLSAADFERVSFLPGPLPRGTPHPTDDLPEGSIVLFLSAFDRRPVPPGDPLIPGAVIVMGPPPVTPIDMPASPRAPSAGAMAGLALVCLLVLTIAGSGWAGSMAVDPIGRVALAPAFGLALLGPVGLLTGRAGLPFDRPGAVGLVALTAALGWGVDLLVRRRALPVERSNRHVEFASDGNPAGRDGASDDDGR
ncbi:MAG: hypothetical protein ACXWW5_08660, partial [Actinomycetota bacterium]